MRVIPTTCCRYILHVTWTVDTRCPRHMKDIPLPRFIPTDTFAGEFQSIERNLRFRTRVIWNPPTSERPCDSDFNVAFSTRWTSYRAIAHYRSSQDSNSNSDHPPLGTPALKFKGKIRLSKKIQTIRDNSRPFHIKQEGNISHFVARNTEYLLFNYKRIMYFSTE